MSDLISRQAAIEAILEMNTENRVSWLDCVLDTLDALPSAEQKIKPIEYRDCSNAMLRMWMDNVVTDGEYNRIMDKLNAHWVMARAEHPDASKAAQMATQIFESFREISDE